MSTIYNFVQLDPRPGRENPEYQFGIEVTIPVPDRVVNLDHHGPKATAETPAACEQALTCELPPEGSTIATVRPDADSITAMAVLQQRANGWPINKDLVRAIGQMDRYGPKVAEEEQEYHDLVVAIARYSTDFKAPLLSRVNFAQCALAGTANIGIVARLVAERDAEYEAALAASEVQVIIPDKLVYVESTHRFATSIGYQHATTVVAFNPEMPIRGEEGTYKKFTVCRWDSNVPTDMDGALAELRELEDGWGGRGDIFGSPQNRDSELAPIQVVATVAKYIDVEVQRKDLKEALNQIRTAGMYFPPEIWDRLEEALAKRGAQVTVRRADLCEALLDIEMMGMYFPPEIWERLTGAAMYDVYKEHNIL